jgi:hypothetical protein
MLFLVTGLPSGFADHCQAAALRLARHVYASAELITGNTLEEIARELLRGGVPHGVVAAHQPGGRLRRALLESGQPFIIAEADPQAALAELVLGRGVELPAAIRLVAGNCAAVRCFRDLPGALVVRADRDGGNQLSLAAAIARHLRLDADEQQIGEIATGLGDTDTGGAKAADWWKSLGQAERAIAEGALGAYLEPTPEHELRPLRWSPELFFVGDRLHEPVTRDIDITGRARCLLRGPQILIPPGDWLLSAAFEASPEAAEHSFVLEVTAGAALGRASIEPHEGGVVRTELAFALGELPDRPIELTLSNERPAFGGHLHLIGVTLTPQPAAPATDRAALGENKPLATS